MIDFKKLTEEEMGILNTLIQENMKRSDFDNYYLFTPDPLEKAKIFTWCFRFVQSVYNVLNDAEHANLRAVLRAELDRNKENYIKVSNLLQSMDVNFNKHLRMRKLQTIMIENNQVTSLIDDFAGLSKKISVISIAKFKGVKLVGESEKTYNKIMKTGQTIDAPSEEDINAEESSEDMAEPKGEFSAPTDAIPSA